MRFEAGGSAGEFAGWAVRIGSPSGGWTLCRGRAVGKRSAEDIVLAKLEWAKRTGSERQVEDVVGILEVQGEGLDMDYMSRWLRELELQDFRKQAMDQAHRR